jgi:pimeloyl-ACP methyl ester carboxylesterase
VKTLLRILGTVGLGWVAWRLLGPDVAPAYVGIQERPLHVPGRTVFVGGRELFVRETGPPDAPPLVLLHGWSFDGEMTYHAVIPKLAERFRVIVPDHRAHGKSDRLRGSFEIADLADDVAGVLDALGLDRVSLFGYSMGGMAAQTFADRYPGRVERLMLGATAAFPVAHRRGLVRILFWLARAAARLSKKEAALFTYRYTLSHGIIDRRHGRWLWEALMTRDPTLYYESGAAVWRFDSRSWVGRLPMPSLVFIPTMDMVVRTETQYELAALLPDAEVIEIDGAGHEAILSRPAAFIDGITDFMERT